MFLTSYDTIISKVFYRLFISSKIWSINSGPISSCTFAANLMKLSPY